MRFKSELTIPAACRIIASGHEQWQQTGSIEPEQLARVRKVQSSEPRQVRGQFSCPVHDMEYARGDCERPDLPERATRNALRIWC